MPKKRANGEGNIRKRSDGRWEGRYTAGYDFKTGKRITKNVLGKTQTEVKAKLKKAMEETAGLDVGRTDEYTVATWLHTWFALYAKPNIRLATQNRYELMMDVYSIPRIAPKVRKVEMHILSPEHMRSYLNAAAQRNMLPMFYLELVSGLRTGELVALLWRDVDAVRHTISVSKQYVRNPNGECVLSRPKTENSVRLVSVPQEAIDLLVQEHQKHPDNLYLFPSPLTGEMYHPDSVVNIHKKILKDAGLEHLKFHELRHTFATTALQNGVDVKPVSAMLGHYDAGFTLCAYTHATRRAQDAAAITMGAVMAQVL